MKTRDEAFDAAAGVLVASDRAMDQMTPRELAEAAWSPTSRKSVDELEDEIRAARLMPPLERRRSA